MAELNIGPTIGQQLDQVKPLDQPRDESGKFVSETKYKHPIAEQQDVHDRLMALVSQDGTSDEWTEEGTPQAQPEPEAASAEQPEPGEEQPAPEEPAGETVDIDYEAPLFQVTVKGDDGTDQTVKLSLKELQSGYMRQKDYGYKTAEVARMRESTQTAIKQEADRLQQAYMTHLQTQQMALVNAIAPELRGVDWQKLSAEDPAEYVRLSARAQQVGTMLQGINQHMTQLQQRQAEQAQLAMAEAVQKSIDTLQKDIPGWNDEIYANILKGGEDYGFSLDELRGVSDARVIKLLHDASKYRQLQAKPVTEKKAVAVPKVIKPGSRTGTNPQTKAADDAAARLRKSGKVQDAASLFLARGIK